MFRPEGEESPKVTPLAKLIAGTTPIEGTPEEVQASLDSLGPETTRDLTRLAAFFAHSAKPDLPSPSKP